MALTSQKAYELNTLVTFLEPVGYDLAAVKVTLYAPRLVCANVAQGAAGAGVTKGESAAACSAHQPGPRQEETSSTSWWAGCRALSGGFMFRTEALGRIGMSSLSRETWSQLADLP